MAETNSTLGEAEQVARTLVGAPVQIHHLVTGGRNSRIYRVCGEEATFALKQYPSRRDDPRDRLATETGALRLMERSNIDTVPRVVGVDRDRGYALLTWIEGAEVTEVTDADIGAAVNFLGAVHQLRRTPWAAEQPLASEACLSGAEIERQFEGRLELLRKVAGDDTHLIDFIDNSFSPAWTRWDAESRRVMRARGLDFEAELPQEWRTLVPSDFGFHNSLRRRDGSLAFLDFEYFGWDDPVKLTADVLLHPGRSLTDAQRRQFRTGVQEFYGTDRNLAARLAAFLPLFGLRWVLILLNEFVPERWQRRRLAGATESWAEAKSSQLARAKVFLAALPQKVEE